MLRKLKNIGRRKKLKKINLNKLRYQILLKAKEHVSKCGWNDKLFYNIAAKSKFKFSEIAVLFPEGYITLLEMYLDTVNNQMTEDSKKINLKISDFAKRLLSFMSLFNEQMPWSELRTK